MNIEQIRTNMINQQLRPSGILDDHLLDVIKNTPREYFVPREYQGFAYADMTIPLEHHQCMLRPTEEGLMLQALKIQATDHVLEIGTGSGYVTALLAQLAKHVDTIDIFEEFSANAQKKLGPLNIDNVKFITADAARGLEDENVYDIIVITGSLPFLPGNFKNHLKPAGRLFAILGSDPIMEATLLTYSENGIWLEKKLFETDTPPLLNAMEPSVFVF